MKAYVILNPVAGQDNPDQFKDLFARYAAEGRWRYDLYETTGEEDLKEIVHQALASGDYDLVVACGGDGTVSGVVDGLAQQDVPLGVLPGGTGNAFAAELGIPDAMEAALDILVGEHEIIHSDLLQIDDRFFVLNATLGVTANSIQAMSREQKDRLGWLAYLVVGIKKLLGLQPMKVTFEVDGQSATFRAAEVMCFNSDATGVLERNLGLGVSINDGRLDLYAFRSRTLWDFIKIIYNIFSGNARKDPHIRYWPVHEQARLTTNPPVPYQADGDLQGETPFTVRLAKDALRVIKSKDKQLSTPTLLDS